METVINIPNEEFVNTKVQMLPCKIERDAEVELQQYFAPEINENKDLVNSFRGRPLVGNQISIPDKYEVVLLEKQVKDGRQVLRKCSNINEFIEWNLRNHHKSADNFQKSLEWLSLSEMLHSN